MSNYREELEKLLVAVEDFVRNVPDETLEWKDVHTVIDICNHCSKLQELIMEALG